MSINVYQIGEAARCTAEFRDTSNALVDPSGFTYSFTTPGGVTTSYTYPGAAQIVRDSLGMFHVELSCTERGVWVYRWASTGLAAAAEQFEFTVEPG